jgi:hypothetical protein
MEFQRKGDPIHTMGIGQIGLIKIWLDQIGLKEKDYKIYGDAIDIEGNLNLRNLGLKQLPPYIKFNKVSGYVNIEGNFFTSLKGFPLESGDDYNCSSNLITSLRGMPLKVNGSLYFHKNKLTDLDNLMISAKNVICYGNPVKFTEQYVRKSIKVSGQVVV